jgi:hypothetical protein
MLRDIVILTEILKQDNTKIKIAGIKVKKERLKFVSKISFIPIELDSEFLVNPKKIYNIQEIEKGTIEVKNILRIFVKRFVLVSSLTKSALVDIGEQRSPKKTPERMAPPRKAGSKPIAFPIAIVMTPMVAADPKAVPVKKETKQFKRNVITRKKEGSISPKESEIMAGIVPAARHKAVIIPINRKTIKIFLTVLIPVRDIFKSSCGFFPFRSP